MKEEISPHAPRWMDWFFDERFCCRGAFVRDDNLHFVYTTKTNRNVCPTGAACAVDERQTGMFVLPLIHMWLMKDKQDGARKCSPVIEALTSR